MQDPEPFLQQMGAELRDPVDPKKKAVLDAGLRAYVNHEVYFFADRKTLARFRKDPLKYCGVVTDPVNRVRFRPTKRSPKREYMMQPYYFTADSTLAAFDAAPDSFAVRKGM